MQKSTKELIKKIIQKKEFSQLPKKDVELALGNFDNENYVDEEKIKLTRNFLFRVFSSFTSSKILNIKDKDFLWILKRHSSTRERLPYYEKLYERIFKNLDKKITLIDLGAGVNGFSYNFLKQFSCKIKYVGVEAMGQLVNLMNYYFKKNKINGNAIHLSLFELEKIKNLIKKEMGHITIGVHQGGARTSTRPRKILGEDFYKGQKIVFLFKTIDSLEIMKRNYSKDLLKEIVPLVDRVVLSFATQSMIRGDKFKAKRNWIINFIKENFNVLDDFELGIERYIVFSKK